MPTRTTHNHSRDEILGLQASNDMQRAIAVASQSREQDDLAVAGSLMELAQLAGTLDIHVIERVVQKRDTPTASYLGDGKLQEIARAIDSRSTQAATSIHCVIVDDELSPGQQRAMELVLKVPVIDRTGLILRIFAQHAQTQRAKLEVEIARLTHALPRIRDDENQRDHQGGGGGRGERGHTSVELVKQQMRERLSTLRFQLERLPKRESKRHNARSVRGGVNGSARVALVGYTNAGKSSWMRALTGSDVLVADKLFATLSLTTRSLLPPTRPDVVITDTVGFIQRLPHELVASFEATLDEARHADLLLIIVDVADPQWARHVHVTQQTLHALGIHTPQQLVLNKVDRLTVTDRVALAETMPGALLVSARSASDVSTLRAAIVSALDARLAEAVIDVPYTYGAFAAEIRSQARVIEEQYNETSSRLRVRAPDALIRRWRTALS